MAMDEAPKERVKPSLGGWKTFPFILAGGLGVSVGASSMLSNLSVYLMDGYNMQPVQSTIISNFLGGCINVAPIVGALLADAYLGCFTVITAGCAASALAMLFFTMTAAVPALRPPPCVSSSVTCQGPEMWQLEVFYVGLALVTIGQGATRFTLVTLGAAQYDDELQQVSFFSWTAFGSYMSSVLVIMGAVYIEDKLGWVVGFGLCAVAGVIGLVVFVLGDRHYHHPKLQKNPLIDIFHRITKERRMAPTESLLHHDKLGDGASYESEAATEEIEGDDLRTLVRLVPLMATGIVMNIYLGLQMSNTFLQAIVMDRSIGPYFSIPLGSIVVFILLGGALAIPLLDFVVYPVWRCITGKLPTSLERVGLGYLITIVAMVYGAISEIERLRAFQTSGRTMSVLWIVPCSLLVGFGEALYGPGTLSFFYTEFPPSLKGLAVAVTALQTGIGGYMGSAATALIRKTLPGWIEDDANAGRLDKVYWLMAAIGMLNFVFFIVCVRLYPKKKEGAKI